MRRLFLVRHAKAKSSVGRDDYARKLTKRGRADAPLIGAYMAHHGLVPDLALVSPATRAEETWALVAKVLPKAPRIVKEEGIYNAGRDKLMGIIRKARDAHVLLVVGHNPGLHELAVALLTDASASHADIETVSDRFPTATAAIYEFDPIGRAHLDSVLFAKELGGEGEA